MVRVSTEKTHTIDLEKERKKERERERRNPDTEAVLGLASKILELLDISQYFEPPRTLSGPRRTREDPQPSVRSRVLLTYHEFYIRRK